MQKHKPMESLKFSVGNKAIVVAVNDAKLNHLINTIVVIEEIIIPRFPDVGDLEAFVDFQHYMAGYRYRVRTVEGRVAVTNDNYLRPIPPEKTTQWDESIFIPDDIRKQQLAGAN